MHIPDGFLGPKTCAACFGITVPVLYLCWRKLNSRNGPAAIAHVGTAAAFVFVLMMFNIPVPGGTTAHATGAALVAIALGPALGILAVSFVLLLQALLFADGGITAYGANCLVMAILECSVGFAVWSILRPASRAGSNLRTGLAGFASGYCAVVASGFAASLLLGAQPLLEKDASGAPMYFPLSLRLTVPVMTGAHLIVGLIEGLITMAAIRAAASMPEFQNIIMAPERGTSAAGRRARTQLFSILGLLILIVPAGILLPAYFKSGSPWGEWSPEEAAQKAGMQQPPAGMQKLSEVWPAPASDYTFAQPQSIASETIQYSGAALLGVAVTWIVFLGLYRLQQVRKKV